MTTEQQHPAPPPPPLHSLGPDTQVEQGWAVPEEDLSQQVFLYPVTSCSEFTHAK